MSIDRFDCTSGSSRGCLGCYTMEKDDLGDWVKFEDYEKLRFELKAIGDPLGTAKQWIGEGNEPVLVHTLATIVSELKERLRAAKDELEKRTDQLLEMRADRNDTFFKLQVERERNDHLQSIIDEARGQEPKRWVLTSKTGTVIVHNNKPPVEAYKFWDIKPLYARAIPADKNHSEQHLNMVEQANIIPPIKLYAENEDDAEFSDAYVNGWNDCREACKASMEGSNG